MVTWPDQIAKWRDFEHFKYGVLHGPKKDKVLQQDNDLFMVNPAGLSWLLTKPNFKQLGCDMLIVDESHNFKHTNTQQFKTLRPWLDKFRRRIILTGSPMPNSMEDLFGQIYLLDQGNFLGQYITHYRMTYFMPTGYGGYKWALQPGAAKKIMEKIKPITLTLRAKDLLSLPKLMTNEIHVELPPTVRKIYTNVEQELFSLLENGADIAAANAAVASGKCRQICGGAVYRTNLLAVKPSDKWEVLHTAKIDALRSLVDELQGKPLLVAYEYDHERVRLLAEFGKDTPCISSKDNATLKRSVDAWNAGQVPLMIGQTSSMGLSLNLQGSSCENVAFFTAPWRFDFYDQLIKRVYRQGTKAKRVVVHHLVVKDTVDELVYAVLKGKDKRQSSFLNALNYYRKSKQISK